MSLELPDIGKKVYFGKRSGTIQAYSTFKPRGKAEVCATYAIVELVPESAAYLESEHGRDCFVTMLIVHPENFTEVMP